MSDLVERLAGKRTALAEQRAVLDPHPYSARVDEARWWLNAIADELEAEFPTPKAGEDPWALSVEFVPAWLRAQAANDSGGDDE